MPQPRKPLVTVVLVDDHDVYRSGLRMLLEAHGVQVVAEAATGAEGLEAALILNPDVLVTDLGLLGMSGSELARRMRQQAPMTRVLVLTDSAAEDDLVEGILAGACGYLLKDSRPEQLLMAVAAAAAGESFLSPRVAEALLERMRNGVLGAIEEPGPDETLTERERRSYGFWPRGARTPRSPRCSSSALRRSRTTSRASSGSCRCTTGSRPPCTRSDAGPSTSRGSARRASRPAR